MASEVDPVVMLWIDKQIRYLKIRFLILYFIELEISKYLVTLQFSKMVLGFRMKHNVFPELDR